jgi:hypothetical protein
MDLVSLDDGMGRIQRVNHAERQRLPAITPFPLVIDADGGRYLCNAFMLKLL